MPKVDNDLYIDILIFVKSERTEHKVQNINSDICDKTVILISAYESDPFVPKVSNDI